MVNDDLRTIAEITKLGFPHGQGFGTSHGVAIIITHHRIFGQEGIVYLKMPILLSPQFVQQDHFFFVHLGLDHRMTVRKGSPLHVLACHSHIVALFQQTRISQELSHGPIQAIVFKVHLMTPLDQADDFSQEFLSFRKDSNSLSQLVQLLQWIGSIHRFHHPLFSYPLKTFPGIAHERCDAGLFNFSGIQQIFFQCFLILLFQLLNMLLINHAFCQQSGSVLIPRILVLRNGLVQQGLSKLGLIPFVVSVLAVAQQIQENVALKTHAVF